MERFVVPSEVLAAHPDDAVRLMQLGALANAVLSVASMASGSFAKGIGERRDALQAMLLMISYLNEAIELIDHRRTWALIEAAVSAGYRFQKPLNEIRQTFSRGRGSLYKTLLFKVRRTKGFHVDEAHFEEWARQPHAPETTLWRKDSRAPLDWAFTASADIQERFGEKIEDAHAVALQDALLLPNLVEAMAGGLLIEASVDPRSAVRRTSRRSARIEFSFSDGRRAFCATVAVVADVNGDPTGSVSDLRDFVTLIFGGRRAGAVIPGTACDIEFSSPHGKAFGWLGPQIEERISANPQDLLGMRAKQMARWGHHRTVQVLQYLDSVQKGAVTPANTEKMVNMFREDFEFWRERDREMDEAVHSIKTGSVP